MPRDSELMALTGLRSTHAVCTHVERLLNPSLHGYPTAHQLLLRGRGAELPILGTVAAGFPSPADEELTDTMSLDEYLIGNKEATYILKVHGNSMRDAGILPGDMLLVERGADPRDGDIVIAQVDREWTMKYFRKRGTAVFLEAANKDYQPIHSGFTNLSSMPCSDLGCWVYYENTLPSPPRSEHRASVPGCGCGA